MEATRNYLLLIGLTKSSAVFGAGVLERLRTDVDARANPLWVDAGGVGIFISTALRADEIWRRALPEHLREQQAIAVKDMLIVELGTDHCGWPGSKAIDWLQRHQYREYAAAA